MTPTFLAIGHFCYDVSPSGYVLGGSAAYSTITARNLGCRARAITAVGNNFDRRDTNARWHRRYLPRIVKHDNLRKPI